MMIAHPIRELCRKVVWDIFISLHLNGTCGKNRWKATCLIINYYILIRCTKYQYSHGNFCVCAIKALAYLREISERYAGGYSMHSDYHQADGTAVGRHPSSYNAMRVEFIADHCSRTSC